MNSEILNEYFGNSWKPNYDAFKYSGWALLEKIKPNETIIDIGCGFNLFKPHWEERLWGIDPANSKADEVVGIMEFETDKQWDVALALGSLNFGSLKDVAPQVEKTVSLVKPGGRIYWRQNPGLSDHPWKGVEAIRFFPWSMELNYDWANRYGCKIVECKWDSGNRIYSEWIKN